VGGLGHRDHVRPHRHRRHGPQRGRHPAGDLPRRARRAGARRSLDALAQDTASGDAATGENLTRDAAAGESPTRDTSAGETAIADRSAGDARIALGADLAAELGIGVGDRVPVTFAGSGEAAGETPAGVVAIFDPDSLVLAAPALVSYDRLAAAAPHAGDTGAFVAWPTA